MRANRSLFYAKRYIQRPLFMVMYSLFLTYAVTMFTDKHTPQPLEPRIKIKIKIKIIYL